MSELTKKVFMIVILQVNLRKLFDRFCQSQENLLLYNMILLEFVSLFVIVDRLLSLY